MEYEHCLRLHRPLFLDKSVSKVAQFEEKYSVFNRRRSAELSADVPDLSRGDQPHVALN